MNIVSKVLSELGLGSYVNLHCGKPLPFERSFKEAPHCHVILTRTCMHTVTLSRGQTRGRAPSPHRDADRHYRPSPRHGRKPPCTPVTGAGGGREGEWISGWGRLRARRGWLQSLRAVKTWLRGQHCNTTFLHSYHTRLRKTPCCSYFKKKKRNLHD